MAIGREFHILVVLHENEFDPFLEPNLGKPSKNMFHNAGLSVHLRALAGDFIKIAYVS